MIIKAQGDVVADDLVLVLIQKSRAKFEKIFGTDAFLKGDELKRALTSGTDVYPTTIFEKLHGVFNEI